MALTQLLFHRVRDRIGTQVAQGDGPEAAFRDELMESLMKKFALLMLLPFLAACAEPEDAVVLETDMSEANMSTDCPVDVSEADRANYPACN